MDWIGLDCNSIIPFYLNLYYNTINGEIYTNDSYGDIFISSSKRSIIEDKIDESMAVYVNRVSKHNQGAI